MTFTWEAVLRVWHKYNQPISSLFICSSLFSVTHLPMYGTNIPLCFTMKNIWSGNWIQAQTWREKKRKVRKYHPEVICVWKQVIGIFKEPEAFEMPVTALLLITRTFWCCFYKPLLWYDIFLLPIFIFLFILLPLSVSRLRALQSRASHCVCLVMRIPISDEACSHCWKTAIMILHSLQKHM